MKEAKKLWSWLAIPCIALAVLTGSILPVLLVRGFYTAQIGPLGICEASGLTRRQAAEAFGDVMDYCMGRRPDFAAGVLPFSAEGAGHFADVRGLFLLAVWVFVAAAGLLLAGAVVCRLRRQRLPRLGGRTPGFWAACGLGGLFHSSTNLAHLTGDAIAIALKRQIELENISYIQIHPTTLYSQKPGRRFLISESVRGEGAVLYNRKMQRFVDELLPRDLLTKAIHEQMEQDESDFVWLSMQEMGSDVITRRFPNIFKHCLEEGYDITRECIPVTPAQHYFMGGIKVDLDSRTSMAHLYAIGEISCNRVHGANRLASNSLLESLVFAKRAAADTHAHYQINAVLQPNLDLADYQDLEQLRSDYKTIILDEIERSKVIERIDKA